MIFSLYLIFNKPSKLATELKIKQQQKNKFYDSYSHSQTIAEICHLLNK